MADEQSESSIEVDKTTRVMCGHCKYTCQDIEELKTHMKANHLQNIPGGEQWLLHCTHCNNDIRYGFICYNRQGNLVLCLCVGRILVTGVLMHCLLFVICVSNESTDL